MITGAFKKNCTVETDTSVFELKGVLMDIFGEESKLNYDLNDLGVELLSLIYDLIALFARNMVSHNLTSLKRYHNGKV